MAAVTSRLQFTTGVYLAPVRHPLVVANAVSSAAVLSGGRVSIGTGVGWMEEEYAAAGQDFKNRGRRLVEMIEILRKLWTGDVLEHHGTFYDFEGLSISPAPERPIPIYRGGDSEPALRHAASLDGWIGSGYTWEDALDRAQNMRNLRRKLGRSPSEPFEIIVPLYGLPDDLDSYRRLEEAGVTAIVAMPWAPWDAPAGEDHGPALRAALESCADRGTGRLTRRGNSRCSSCDVRAGNPTNAFG
jgi:alkanesulfonate monooxygenase SsuD/methylene tetrahydromethanopterin reductase-like flavin-dependent oxidoreductase (luciferase family)